MINLLPVPASSQQLQITLTRIKNFSSSEAFFDRHVKAVAQTVGAIFITTLDTLVYSAKALTYFLVEILDLEFYKGFEALAQNGGDAIRSLYMIATLTACAALRILLPQTIFDNFPTFVLPIDYKAESARLQEELGKLQIELDTTKQDLQAAQCRIQQLKTAPPPSSDPKITQANAYLKPSTIRSTSSLEFDTFLHLPRTIDLSSREAKSAPNSSTLGNVAKTKTTPNEKFSSKLKELTTLLELLINTKSSIERSHEELLLLSSKKKISEKFIGINKKDLSDIKEDLNNFIKQTSKEIQSLQQTQKDYPDHLKDVMFTHLNPFIRTAQKYLTGSGINVVKALQTKIKELEAPL